MNSLECMGIHIGIGKGVLAQHYLTFSNLFVDRFGRVGVGSHSPPGPQNEILLRLVAKTFLFCFGSAQSIWKNFHSSEIEVY